jgi:hypothetical protein
MTKIAELEAALAARDARIAVLQDRLARYERAAPVARLDGAFCLPDADQWRVLADMVVARWPVLLGKASVLDDERRREFAAAFTFVSSLDRTPGEIDTKHANGYWVDTGACDLPCAHVRRSVRRRW